MEPSHIGRCFCKAGLRLGLGFFPRRLGRRRLRRQGIGVGRRNGASIREELAEFGTCERWKWAGVWGLRWSPYKAIGVYITLGWYIYIYIDKTYIIGFEVICIYLEYMMIVLYCIWYDPYIMCICKIIYCNCILLLFWGGWGFSLETVEDVLDLLFSPGFIDILVSEDRSGRLNAIHVPFTTAIKWQDIKRYLRNLEKSQTKTLAVRLYII